MKQELSADEASPRYYQVGGYIVDTWSSNVAHLDGRPVVVSEGAYAVLAALVKAGSEGVSLTTLRSALGNVDEASVRAHAQELRTALNAAPGDDAYIQMEETAGEMYFTVTARAVRPKASRRKVPGFLLPLMIGLVIAVPVLAYLLGS